jgi:hypothetical protein
MPAGRALPQAHGPIITLGPEDGHLA